MSDMIERPPLLKRLRTMAATGWNRIGDEAADEIERLTAALQYEQHRAGRQGTHGDGCADWGPEHYECAIRERDDLRRQLAEAEQDARRYRHLVEKHSTEVDDYGTLGITFRCDFEHYNDSDAAIDAAMGLTRPAEES